MDNAKFQDLLNMLRQMQGVLLALSGGVDSTFLLKAIQVSGINALSITAATELIPHEDVLTAQDIAKELGIRHRTININMLSIKEFVRNTSLRCFFCKDRVYREMQSIGHQEGLSFMLDGSTLDDMNEFRPGRKAAERYNVRSPLMESHLSKSEIRQFSRQLGLPTWDKPSSPCLVTRFPYGQRITKKALTRVKKAENYLRALGFREFRVRSHGSVARIEVGSAEIPGVLEEGKREAISAALKSIGYAFISLDIDGYRSGSMDRILKKNT